jgi:hypothetical protein
MEDNQFEPVQWGFAIFFVCAGLSLLILTIHWVLKH